MTCVIRGHWRLLSDVKGLAKGEPELYDLSRDPLQKTNLLAQEPVIAAELRAAYDAWWQATEPLTKQRAFVSLGSDAQPVVTLSSAEWRDNAMGGVHRWFLTPQHPCIALHRANRSRRYNRDNHCMRETLVPAPT